MAMKYCNNCKQWVQPYKKFHGCLFVFLLFTLVGWIIYLIWRGFQPYRCPICKGINWGLPQEEKPTIYYVQPQVPLQQKPIQESIYCEYCGFKNDKKSKHCVNCGSLLKK